MAQITQKLLEVLEQAGVSQATADYFAKDTVFERPDLIYDFEST